MKFWHDMLYRVGLKRTDKIMVGNVDTGASDYIDVKDLVKPLERNDFPAAIRDYLMTKSEREYLNTILLSIECDAYSDFLLLELPTRTTFVRVLNDENKGKENALYIMYPDGSKEFIITLPDN